MNKKTIALLGVLSIIAFVAWSNMRPSPSAENGTPSNLVEVKLPENLTPEAKAGKLLFDENCAICHGENAAGVDGSGPPLVHKIYEPSHHGDEAFQRAVALGVRNHHWRFGDMAPVDGIDRAEVEQIISYVRELQLTNGIN